MLGVLIEDTGTAARHYRNGPGDVKITMDFPKASYPLYITHAHKHHQLQRRREDPNHKRLNES